MRSLPHTLQATTTSRLLSWTSAGLAVADANALPPWVIVSQVIVLPIMVLPIMVLPIMLPPQSGWRLPPPSALLVSQAPEKTALPPAAWCETDSQLFRAPARRKERQRPQGR